MSNDQLVNLGERLVRCKLHCDGVTNDPPRYIIPRTLNVEIRDGKKPIIVIGINPGRCDEVEINRYRTEGISYSAVSGYFHDTGVKKPLFNRTKDVIRTLGYEGNILWTNLVKCQSSGKNGLPPIQTLRVCVNEFLVKEIGLFESDTVVALGRTAFNYAALSFPEHLVIGMPHPTGGWRGNKGFKELWANVKEYPQHYRERLASTRDLDGHAMAVHLSDIVLPS